MPDIREELVAEAVALTWRYFVTLTRRCNDPSVFITTLARRAAQAALAGRRLAGAERASDVLSPLARLRGRVKVDRLGARVERDGRRPGEVIAEELAVADPRVSVPDQAAFRVDFPRFQAGLTLSARAGLDILAAGWGTGAAVARLGAPRRESASSAASWR